MADSDDIQEIETQDEPQDTHDTEEPNIGF